MTNEQAIERLIAIKNIIYGDDLKALDLATQALEKQIPKKLTDIYSGYNGEEIGTCKCLCDCLEHYNYCPRCGQKLDWS